MNELVKPIALSPIIFVIVFLFSPILLADNTKFNSSPEILNIPVVEVITERIKKNEVVVLNTLDDLERGGGFMFSSSKISGPSASYFTLYSETKIKEISWSGFVNEQGVKNNQANFIIHFYKDVSGFPSDKHFYELSTEAVSDKVNVINDYATYVFKSKVDVQLTAGSYWVSVMDPETDGLNFSWHIEKGKQSTIFGSGGAFRKSPNASWKSLNDGVEAINARGKSLFILGVN